MVEQRKPLEFPTFPSLFTEKDFERMQELERLAKEQQRAYRGITPWVEKPAIERGIRRVAEKAIAPPQWLRKITPWQEFGLTPEQADIYIRETEEELQELKRREFVAARVPSIMDYITALAVEGLLTGETAQLYELIPELNPNAPPMDRLDLMEEERDWFIEHIKSLVGKPKEEIYRLYAEGGFPAPKTVEELLDLVKTVIPQPRFVLTTVALSREQEDITAALQAQYAPQVEEGLEPSAENIKSELRSLGLEPTGDVKKDIEALNKARAEQVKVTGKPTRVMLEDGTPLSLDMKEDGYYSEGIKVANIDPDTQKAVPLTLSEEFELDNTSPIEQETLDAILRRLTLPDLTEAQVGEFWATDGSTEQIKGWLFKYGFTGDLPLKDVKDQWIKPYVELWSGVPPRQPIGTELMTSYNTGWGDVLSVAGGASRWLGAEGVGEFLSTQADKLQAGFVDDFGEFQWKYAYNPRYLLLRGARLTPFALTILPVALIGWQAGVAAGGAIAIRFALGAFATKIITTISGAAVGGTIARTMESAMEAGSAFDSVLDKGGTVTEADEVADKVFWDNMKLVGLDATQIAAALAPVPTPLKVIGRSINRNLFRVARVGGRMTIVGLTEAGEEAWQERSTRVAMGEEDPWKFDPEMQEAAFLGGMMGIGLGGGGDVLSGIINTTKENISPTQKERFDKDVEEVGEAEALNKLAETPAGAKIVEGAVGVAKEQALNREIKDSEKRVHTEEVKFLEDQLLVIERESALIRESHRVQSERLEATTLPYERAEIQGAIKNLEGILSDLNTKKASIQAKLDILGRPVPEAVVPAVPEAMTEESWSALPYSSKVALAESVGIAKTAAKLAWGDLTIVQQGRLGITPVPRAAPVASEVLSPEQEVMGEAFNVRVAEEQAENLEGYQEAVVTIDDVARTAREALEHIDVQFFNADGSNPLDIAATAAWKLGSISEYVKLLPDDIYDNVSQEFKDADFADVAEWNLNSMDTIRAFSAIDKGHFGGAARRKVLSPTERLHMAYFNVYGAYELKYLKLEQESGLERPAWYKFRRKAKFNKDTFALMENISQTDSVAETSELLQRDVIKEAVKDYSQEMQESMVDWAKRLRTLWDELITDQNAVRVKLGLEPIEYRDNYVSWVYEPNIWSRFLGTRLSPDFVRETAVAPDFIRPTEPFVAHALAREGGLAGYTKITDVRKLFLDYADTAARDMFFTPIVMNAKAHARVLRGKGLKAPAQWMLDWATESYAGLPSFISRAFRKSAFAPLRRPLIALRRNLTRAVFPLNWTWNFFVQTSSIALTVGQYGVRNTAMASQYLWNGKIRKLINDDCFSHIIKKRAEGSMVYQDLGASISRFQYVGRTPLQTVEWAANYLTRAIETNVTGVSCYAAYREGQRRGLTGRALIDYASEGGAKTQSMYNVQNVPGTIRSPEIGAIFPFQTFCFEAMNFVRELSGVKYLKAGAYETIAADTVEGQGLINSRVKHFFEFMAAIYVLNIVGDFAIDRRPWQPTSFIPFVGIMMSGLEPYNPWYYPMPVRYMSEFTRARNDIVEYGNWNRMRAWILKYHALGGVQISRTIDGIIASIEGEVKDVSGEVMFEFEDKPIEYFKAIMMGTWQTEAGREYRERMLEGADPTTVRIVKDLVKLEEQLGTDVKGKYYTLGKGGTEALTKMRSVDIPQWQIMGEETGYPLIWQFRLYCDIMWEEYNKVPADQRLEYRKDNSYIDATLYFWEKVGTLRSDEATEDLERLFKEFIAGNLRAHWRGLPEIPEEIKLLPD